MNKAQLAQAFGVSTNTVSEWVRKGCPVEKKGRNGDEFNFHVPAVITWRVEDLVSQALGIMKKGGTDIAEALRREAFAKAEMREIELAEKRRELINVEAANRLIGRGIMDCRSRLLALPTKLAPVVILCKTAAKAKGALQKGVDDALLSLSGLQLAEDLLEVHDEPLEAAAAPDGQRVGRPAPPAQPGKQRRAGPVGHLPGGVPARDHGQPQRPRDRKHHRDEQRPGGQDGNHQ